MAYTIIGETISVAEKLEGMTKEFQTSVLLSKEFFVNLSLLKDSVTLISEDIYKIPEDVFLRDIKNE